ncbi:hypothetical protein AVEN_187281-1 [Araneus ventricosus]|uniref:Uncharacterized protein n=1 Tax=Araneus ventricosus TaxID=182803 RepID=A0A4Y2GTJ8_ARAVE|nr:hypothetical protein AVEN_187281-1 [Araneus ventricosus]
MTRHKREPPTDIFMTSAVFFIVDNLSAKSPVASKYISVYHAYKLVTILRATELRDSFAINTFERTLNRRYDNNISTPQAFTSHAFVTSHAITRLQLQAEDNQS